MINSTTITRYELSSTFEEFDAAMNRKRFIGPRALRPRLVGLQAANVGKLPVEALLITKDDARAPGAGYKRSDAEFTTFSYATEEHGHEVALDDRQIAIYRDVLDAEDILSQRAADIVLRNYEIACAAALYDTTVWTGAPLTTAITHEWDDATNGVPITNIEAARRKVRSGSGLDPNALICNRDQLWNLANTAQVIDRLKYAGFDDPKNFTKRAIAELLDLEFILVAGGFKNASKEGQDASLSSIWSDEYAMVARVAVTDDPQESCVGRTFIWTGDGPGGVGDDEELAILTEEYRDEKVRGSVLRARNDRDIVVMYAQAAHLMSNVTTI